MTFLISKAKSVRVQILLTTFALQTVQFLNFVFIASEFSFYMCVKRTDLEILCEEKHESLYLLWCLSTEISH